MNDTNSLAHTKWNCKYYIAFGPKYRRKVFFGEKRREIGKILRQLCEWKKAAIVEAEVCPDHIHMLLKIPPKIAVSSFVREPSIHDSFSYVITLSFILVCIHTSNMMLIPKSIMRYYSLVQYLV